MLVAPNGIPVTCCCVNVPASVEPLPHLTGQHETRKARLG